MIQRFKTSFLLWALFAFALFAPCWFVPWHGKGDTTFAGMMRCYRAGLPMTDYAIFALVYALPALLIGWVLQALVVVCLR